MKPERSWFLLAAWIMCLTPAFLLFILFFSNTSITFRKQSLNPITFIPRPKNYYRKCDLFTGQWVRDLRGSSYSNWSCPTSMIRHNCLMYGKDASYINWRWKPDQCELPRFDPKAFLSIVRGKTMAFIGDSVAKNQMVSILCLLSQEVTPTTRHTDDEDYFQTWHFPSHNFTLEGIWSPWLVFAEEKIEHSNVFNLHLDKVDQEWSKRLPDMDYAIISSMDWFERSIYLYNEGALIGCLNCYDTNVTTLDLSFTFRIAFQTALNSVNRCEECKGLVAWFRTSSASHFKNGLWKERRCNRTGPLSLNEVKNEVKLGGASWEVRKIQVEETGKGKKKAGQRGIRFRILDITNAMYMRPDAHPDIHCPSYIVNDYRDCLHWCLPGPIDVWNDLLLAMMKDEDESSLR